ncbi:T-cell surface glycoprotein CD8 beta chain-like [Tachysurus fulvidraco]|uniref:T-cell surface glycoprotein CD8 beta chain-like n=1 Tax=Tachysurus fulvidraco TaxID=1234273 RepID=UPI001FEEDDB9|nr:T-cell surface glycoprotein CD8 beta chain-like [Tachysurus fulvidraco]
MIRLFVALCALFSLFTAVKTSDIKEIDVITVKRGENVTMKCSISSDTKKDSVVWYRQISGKLPQFIAKSYTSNLGYKFIDGFNDARFSISVNDNKFDLSINNTREDDEGEYFCGEMEGSVVKFTSGTRLQFEDKDTTHRPTSGTTDRDSPNSNKTGEHDWINPLIASNIFSVIVITLLLGVLYKNHRKDASSSNHQIPTNQTAAADDVLNYAAVSFAKKPSSSRTSRAKNTHEDVYAQVKIK